MRPTQEAGTEQPWFAFIIPAFRFTFYLYLVIQVLPLGGDIQLLLKNECLKGKRVSQHNILRLKKDCAESCTGEGLEEPSVWETRWDRIARNPPGSRRPDVGAPGGGGKSFVL